MGFTTGFTGGVTVTLSLAYLTVLTHQRNRENQAAILRQQTQLLTVLHDPLPPTLPPTRAELAAYERANLVETAKDRWNAEVEHAVRWAQTKDWDEVREGVETAATRLWRNAVGGASETATEVEKGTKNAVNEARTKAAEAEAKTESAASGLMSRGWQALGLAKSTAEEAADKSKEGIAAASSKASNSSVEKALQERYQKAAEDKRSAEELLAARYKA